MKKNTLYKIISLITGFTVLLSSSMVCLANPSVKQDRKTGEVVLSGLNGTTEVSVEILKPTYEGGDDISESDIENIVFIETPNDTERVPIDVKGIDMYTIKLCGKEMEETFETQIYCVDIGLVKNLIDKISASSASEIMSLFNNKDNLRLLDIPEKEFVKISDEGKRELANKLENNVSSIDDFTNIYNSVFGMIAVTSALKPEDAVAFFEKYIDIEKEEAVGIEDYKSFSRTAKNTFGELISKKCISDRKSFDKALSVAIFLTDVSASKGIEEFKAAMNKFAYLIPNCKYYSLSDTYAVDRAIAGRKFETLTELETVINQ